MFFRLTVAGSISVAIGFVAYWRYISSKQIATENAYVEADIVSVNSRIMGHVRDVNAQENQRVKKGETVVKLDDDDVKIELLYKEAKFKKAQADYERARKMRGYKGISEADYELAEATMTGHKADLEGSRLKLSFTEVKSPIDGVVARRSAHEGQFVQPGQSLMVVVPTEKIWIRANYKENQVRNLRAGQRVEIEVDAYPGKIWTGKIDSIYPSTVASLSLLPPENTTGNFTKVVQRFSVKISIDKDEGGLLKPGMSVVPKVIVD